MIRGKIRKLILRALRKEFVKSTMAAFSVNASENIDHGDYSTNVALVGSRVARTDAFKTAAALAEELTVSGRKLFIKVEAVPPGFINFWLKKEILYKELLLILQKKQNYGKGAKKKGKIQVEFISANPNGPLTVANARGGFFGDVLSRVLKHQGYEVEQEFYINDAGNQIYTLGLSLLAAAGLFPYEEGYYQGDHLKIWAKTNADLLERYKQNPEKIGRKAARDFMKFLIRPSIKKKMKIDFDRWTSEHDHIRERGYVQKALKLFAKKGLTYKKDGALWLKTTDFSDDKDRVLVTGDGYYTYFLVDAGHYLETKERSFSKINILGADHHGYVARIQAAAKIVGLKKSEVIVTQLVRLVRHGQEVRMSKRSGVFVTIDELIDEVGLDAARYFFLEKSLDTHINFDLDLAKKRSLDNPVFYIQYAHARMDSILRKAKKTKGRIAPATLRRLDKKEELFLISKLQQFSEVAEDTARDFQVHRMMRYVLELARIFHNFYEKYHVISEDIELTRARLVLVQATQIVLRISLDLLGILAPRRM